MSANFLISEWLGTPKLVLIYLAWLKNDCKDLTAWILV